MTNTLGYLVACKVNENSINQTCSYWTRRQLSFLLAKFPSSTVEAVEALMFQESGFMKHQLTAVLFIRTIITVWFSVTHMGVKDTLFPVSARCGAEATLKTGSRSCYGRTAQLIRSVVALRTTITHGAPGDAAPPVLTPEVS